MGVVLDLSGNKIIVRIKWESKCKILSKVLVRKMCSTNLPSIIIIILHWPSLVWLDFWFFPALLDLRQTPYYLSTFLLRYGAQVIKIGPVPRGTGTLPSQFCPQCFHYYKPTLVSLSPQYFFMMTKLNWCLYHLFTQRQVSPSHIYIMEKNQWKAECLIY